MSETVLPTEMNTVADNYGYPTNIVFVREPSYTHKLNLDSQTVSDFVDNKEAYRQAVVKLLSTERYDHIIYTTNYGVELRSLFGMSIYYVVPELVRRITEAVMQDDRTTDVYGFDFDTTKKGVVSVKFHASSIYGDVEIEKEVEI